MLLVDIFELVSIMSLYCAKVHNISNEDHFTTNLLMLYIVNIHLKVQYENSFFCLYILESVRCTCMSHIIHIHVQAEV